MSTPEDVVNDLLEKMRAKAKATEIQRVRSRHGSR